MEIRINPNIENSQSSVQKILSNSLLPATSACQPLLPRNDCLNTPTYHNSSHPYNLLHRVAGRQEHKYQPASQEGLTGAERTATQTGRQTDRHGRVNAFAPHSDVQLCHPSRESISVSSRLAARHQERHAQKGDGR